MQTLTVPTTFEHLEISATTCTAKCNIHATNQNQTQVLTKPLPLPHCIQDNENQHRERFLCQLHASYGKINFLQSIHARLRWKFLQYNLLSSPVYYPPEHIPHKQSAFKINNHKTHLHSSTKPNITLFVCKIESEKSGLVIASNTKCSSGFP